MKSYTCNHCKSGDCFLECSDQIEPSKVCSCGYYPRWKRIGSAQKETAVAEKTIDNSDMEQLLCNTCKEFNVCELVAQKLRALECVEYAKA